RGDFASALFRPTLVAPGVGVVSVRGSSVANVTGAQGMANGDLQRLSSSELPYYTTSSGTSFSAPQVAGTIALMLEANPSLTPADVRDILQATATPLAPYYQHDVGAGMLNAHAAVLQAAFPDRHIGEWRGSIDAKQVSFGTEPAITFSGIVQPGAPFEATVQVPADTVVASLQIGWGPMTSLNDLALSVYDPAGNLAAQSNALNLPGINGRSERVSLNLPSAGTWRIKVTNALPIGTPQAFSGVFTGGRAHYSPMDDIQSLNANLRSDILQNVRSFAMWPLGAKFRPAVTVTRADLAAALFLGSRIPQYLPALATYSDVRDKLTMSFVESAQANPAGPLFVDVSAGGKFRPNENVTRLAAAVALVRAAGLRSEAETAVAPLSFLDSVSIPAELRGYVSVAVSKGLLSSGGLFQPQNTVSRAELAHAIAVIENRAIQ
ncbi:MAG TPA: S8 family serine peptidase, partial [Pyrinomonadaceae bacterium]